MMAKDKRIKGCSNENCEMHIDKKKMSVDDSFCPKCGSKLMYVCSKCFKEIEDNGPEHKLCLSCEAEAEAKKEKIKDTAKAAAGKVGAAGIAVGGAFVGGMQKQGVKQAAAVGSKVVKGIVEVVPKVIK